MVEGNEASPLALAAEQYATVNKYAGAFLQAFTFQSARRHDPLLAAISLLKRLYAERRRTLRIASRSPISAKLIVGSSSNTESLIAVSTRLRRSRLCETGFDQTGAFLRLTAKRQMVMSLSLERLALFPGRVRTVRVHIGRRMTPRSKGLGNSPELSSSGDQQKSSRRATRFNQTSKVCQFMHAARIDQFHSTSLP